MESAKRYKQERRRFHDSQRGGIDHIHRYLAKRRKNVYVSSAAVAAAIHNVTSKKKNLDPQIIKRTETVSEDREEIDC